MMFDVNSLTLILLAEACVILLITLLVVVWLQIKSKNKHRKAVVQLVSQIKIRSKTRVEETEAFLRLAYGLSDTELSVTSKTIDLQERLFLQKMVDVLIKSDADQITSLDASIIDLIDVYKSLKPTLVESITKEGTENSSDDLEMLRAENATLTEELKTMREKMMRIQSEFGGMFAGLKADSADSSNGVDKVGDPNDPPVGQSDFVASSETDPSKTDSNGAEKKIDLP
jgi:hypothetical protein